MTTVEAQWYPAIVRFPNGITWSRTYVVIARGGDEDGLHIWRQPSDTAEWTAAINWAATTVPSDHQARNGVPVRTDQGLVVITLSQGCRCGALGSWRGPDWANTVRSTA